MFKRFLAVPCLLRGSARHRLRGDVARASFRLRFLLTLCLLCLGWSSAQNLLDDPLADDYRRATDALEASISAFPDDQVGSLDALRRARAAFAPLSEGLEETLKRGLSATFARAEGAIVNRSETDLRVQVAVLRGGFQRALYEGALEGAEDGNLPLARTFLGVLAGDLGFDREFSGADRQSLQTTFEQRLADLSLRQLNRLGDDQGSRYETLARIYGHIFLVQDSPHLPVQTQATLLHAVQALIAGKPLAPPLKTLRAQLTQFERATHRTGNGAAAVETDTVAQNSRVPSSGAQSNGAQSSRVAETSAPAKQAAERTSQPTRAEPVAPPALPSGASEATLPGTIPAQNPTSAASASATERLVGDLRSPLLIASGLLAFAALLRSLHPSRSRRALWRDAALALLLLPAVAEGVIVLTTTLGPLVKFPLPTLFITEVAGYSLFTNPLTQLLWALIVMLASCLALGRTSSAASDEVALERSTPAAQPPPATTSLPAPPLLASSGLDWDEDF